MVCLQVQIRCDDVKSSERRKTRAADEPQKRERIALQIEAIYMWVEGPLETGIKTIDVEESRCDGGAHR